MCLCVCVWNTSLYIRKNNITILACAWLSYSLLEKLIYFQSINNVLKKNKMFSEKKTTFFGKAFLHERLKSALDFYMD